jgi:hypothetical protein
MNKTIWIARNKNGDLYLLQDKPTREYNYWDVEDNDGKTLNFSIGEKESWVKLNNDYYPEVTWENSPIELILNLPK